MVHRIYKDLGSTHMHLLQRVPTGIVDDLNALVLVLLTWLQAHCAAADEALSHFRQDKVRTPLLYLPFNHICAYTRSVTYTACSAASIHEHQATDEVCIGGGFIVMLDGISCETEVRSMSPANATY
jgi:hypothetical protein